MMSPRRYTVKKIKFLMLEDSSQDEEIILKHLEQNGLELKHKRLQSLDAFKQALLEESWDLVLSDYHFSHFTAYDALKVLHENDGGNIPFIVVSRSIGEEMAIEIMRAGAADYVMKDRLGRLSVAVEREIREGTYRLQSSLQLAQMTREANLVIETIPQGIWRTDPDGSANYFSERFYELVGYSADEFLGWGWSKVIHEDDRDRVLRVWQESRDNRAPVTVDFRIKLKSGEYRWFLSLGNPFFDDEGKLVKYYGTWTDIHEQKIFQDRIRLSEEKFRGLASSMPQLVWTATEDGTVDYYNERIQEYAGAVKQTDGEWKWNALIHPDDMDLTNKAWNTAVREKKFYNVEHRVQMKDGSYRWHISRSLPVRDIFGKIHWYGTATDVQAIKEVEEVARESEAKFRTITNAMPQMIWSTLPDGFHDYYNDRWYEFTGMPYGSTDGDAWNDVFHPDDQERAWKSWRHSLETGDPYEIEYRLRHKSGEYRWTLGRALPIHDDKGKIIRWMGTCTEIQQQKETAQALEEAVKARDEFLSIASHELKTPLTSLHLQFQLQQRGMKKNDPRMLAPERIEQLTSLAERLTTRLNHLVDDMLDISRIRSGKLSFDKKYLDISLILKEVVERMIPLLVEQGCGEPQLSLTEAYGMFDPLRMEQVFINLLTNAMKYGKGSPIEISMDRSRDQVLINVRDYGRGVGTDLKQKIFERFERGVNPSEVSGLGLGLFISRQIVERHEGRIWVEGEEGQGATFKVLLPLSTGENHER